MSSPQTNSGSLSPNLFFFCGLIWPFKWVLEVFFFFPGTQLQSNLISRCHPGQAQRQRADRSFTCTLLGFNPETP